MCILDTAVDAARENEERFQQLAESVQQRNPELALLYEAGQALNSTLDLDQVLVTVLEETRRLLGVVASSVWLIDPETNELVCRQATGPNSEMVRHWRLAPDEGIAGWVASSGQSLIVPDAFADTRHFEDLDRRTGLVLRSILSAPLRVKEEIIGVLQVVDTEVDRFSATDLRLIESLGASAAIAIENARLYERAQQEISERVRAEEALRASESRYRALFNNASDAIFIHDLEGHLVGVNQVACERLGYSREELERMTLMDIDAAEYGTPAAQKGKELREYDPILFETAHVRRDGTTVPIELSSRAIEYDGKPAVLSIARDITERKRMEQYILRTERLAAMGHLAAAIAHEINNPLQSIGSSMELVMDFPLEEEERQGYLEAVQGEIKRLGAITNRVLDFARPPQVEHRPIWLSEVVRYALTLTGKQLQHSGIQVNLDLPDESPRVVGSRDRLVQVFLNLIINAIEAMPDGGELEIAARTVENQMELTFSDSGPGIPSHTWHTIFEPFYTTKEEGTGLGLAISYSIVQDHGGTITAGNASLDSAKTAVGSAKTAVGGAKIAVTLPMAPSSTS